MENSHCITLEISTSFRYSEKLILEMEKHYCTSAQQGDVNVGLVFDHLLSQAAKRFIRGLDQLLINYWLH